MGLLFETFSIKQKFFIRSRWEAHPSQIFGYKSQVHFYRRQYPNATLFVQRGTEQDCFTVEKNEDVSCNVFSLSPNSYLGAKKKAISTLVTDIFIKENGYLKGGLKCRQIYRLHLQAGVELC